MKSILYFFHSDALSVTFLCLFTKAVISETGKCLNEKYILTLKLDNHKNTNFSKHLLFSQTLTNQPSNGNKTLIEILSSPGP